MRPLFAPIPAPLAVHRSVRGISDQDALLVLITGKSDEDFGDIAVAPADSKMMLERFGMDVIRKYQAVGTEFLGATV